MVKVRTLQLKNTDWNYDRKPIWGVYGTIIDRQTGHGTCYLVKHDDGTEEWYDVAELELV